MKIIQLIVIFLSLSATLSAQDRSGILLDRIVAVVNDGVVLKSELDAQTNMIVQRLRDQATQLPPRNVLEEQILERLIVTRIQLQRAEQVGIQIDDDSLNRALTAVAARNNIPFNNMPAALAAQGIEYSDYREQVRREMIVERLRARDVISRINVTPGEIEARMRRQAENDESVEYRVLHILVATPSAATTEDIEQTETRAVELHDRLQQGEDFAQLAVAYSNGAQALEGGDLGFKTLSEMPTLFVQVIPGMEVGDISNPIASSSGFHIIKLADTRGSEKQRVMITQRHARHILVTPNAILSDAGAQAKVAELRERIVAGEPFDQLARDESDDAVTGSSGGDLDWNNPGTFDPSFEAALNALEVGELSQPVRSVYGWHVIELLEVREHDGTLELQRNRVIAQIRSEKEQVDTERWTRQLRDEAYVQTRL